MIYKVVGSRRVVGVDPGGEVSEVEIAEAGASVSHLVASGHIAPAGPLAAAETAEQVAPEQPAPAVKGPKKATSFIPADEAVAEENQ